MRDQVSRRRDASGRVGRPRPTRSTQGLKRPLRRAFVALVAGPLRGTSWAAWRARSTLPIVAAIAAPLAGAAAFVLLRYADWGAPRDPPASGGVPELGVWQVLIAAQVVVWMLIASAGLRALAELDEEIDGLPSARTAARRARWRRETAAFLCFTYGVLVLFLVLGGIAGMRNPNVMVGQGWKTPLLHVIAGVATLPFFLVLKRVQLCATEDSFWSPARRGHRADAPAPPAPAVGHRLTRGDHRVRRSLDGRAAPGLSRQPPCRRSPRRS